MRAMGLPVRRKASWLVLEVVPNRQPHRRGAVQRLQRSALAVSSCSPSVAPRLCQISAKTVYLVSFYVLVSNNAKCRAMCRLHKESFNQ